MTEDFQSQAHRIVMDYASSHQDKSEPYTPFEVYTVWFAKTLQNWKALISTTLPDGRYYEVTHDGDGQQTYLDVYVKLENVSIPDVVVHG